MVDTYVNRPILVDASNIAGGGKVLLDYLLSELESRRIPYNAITPDDKDKNNYIKLFSFKKNPFSRHRKDSIKRRLQLTEAKTLLCFGNLPPPCRFANTRHLTYFQNALLIPHNRVTGLSLYDRLRLSLLRFSIKNLSSNTDKWIVQTEYTKRQLCEWLSLRCDNVEVLPFFNHSGFDYDLLPSVKKTDFFYSSALMAHKNHINLLRAVMWVCDHGLNPSIRLTIDERGSKTLNRLVTAARKKGAVVDCVGSVSHQHSLKYCSASRAIIFPSLVETVGLGLLEAADLQKVVLASDLPWISEIITTELLFDPNSVTSMGHTMLKYLTSQPSRWRIAERVMENKIDCFVGYLSENV